MHWKLYIQCILISIYILYVLFQLSTEKLSCISCKIYKHFFLNTIFIWCEYLFFAAPFFFLLFIGTITVITLQKTNFYVLNNKKKIIYINSWLFCCILNHIAWCVPNLLDAFNLNSLRLSRLNLILDLQNYRIDL